MVYRPSKLPDLGGGGSFAAVGMGGTPDGSKGGDSDVQILASWLEQELLDLASSLESPDTISFLPQHRVPDKPRVGNIVYADGTDWNPGAGEGLYEYRADAAWHKL